ncbi:MULTISPECIES: sugar ABC transporter ATP-binding protein [unclassified Beijerinckia]|uniref:sugar ABC transporter ATP-binding protein n=1 Tax=unclassified Beijerinckia TaxID=2638183 RepID=UPI00089764D0|nr:MULTISPECIES: sugar ABC transporter ATP-binding protein [unclassified Beijerinckia]MDH7796216.1 ribose transport system ATP-binding protein [Beijerinckia sp. GAS462]SEC35447.1 ribose transport system ATP-binding protein [Beijerinckia sp. 28-YEA-48]
MSPPSALSVAHLSRRFGATQALQDVSFDLAPGECLALLGQNGAGKSTLIKILSGLQRQDSGTIKLFGDAVAFAHRRMALDAGLVVVPQELRVVPLASVAENVMLGRLPSNRLFGVLPQVDRQALRREAAAALALVGVSLDLDRPAGALSFAERQMIVIARALGHRARILMLDEPTAALDRPEVEHLFTVLRRLKQQGVALIYVSHRLKEIDVIADKLLVLRDGRVAMNSAAPPFPHSGIISAMTGHVKAPEDTRHEFHEAGAEVARQDVNGVVIACQRARCIGLGGLLGSGISTVVRRFFGSNGSAISRSINRGWGYLPPERALALVHALSVRDNIVLPHLRHFATAFGRDEKKIDQAVMRMMQMLDVRPLRPDLPVRALSGGNQQKVALARWLVGKIDLLLLDEPTHGIDVAAKDQIHAQIRRFVAKGGAVLMASSDVPELLSISDEIKIMRQGHVTGSLRRDEGFDELAFHALAEETA